MDSLLRRSLSRNRRALDFATAHPLTDAGFTAVYTRLQGVVSRADELAVQENAGSIDERAARAQRRALRRSIRQTWLVRLVRVAEKASATNPGLLGKFVLPSYNLPVRQFLVAAHHLLDVANQEKDILTPLGLGEHFFDELTAAVQQLDAVSQIVHGGRDGHVAARAELEAVARAASSEIAILGTFYRSGNTGDAELYAAWKAASKIPGPFKHPSGIEPSPEPAPNPAPVMQAA